MAKKKEAKTKEVEYTADKIVEMIDRKRDSQAFKDLCEQFETDFDLFSLKPYVAEADHQAYTSPKPLNDFNKVLAGLNKASLTWNIQCPDDAKTKVREAAVFGEKFLTGVLNMADRNLRRIGEPPLRKGAGWFACARGALGALCLIYVNEDKKQVYDLRAVDPLHMTWEQGVDGFIWADYEYEISAAEAKDRYGVDLGSDEVNARVIVFFTRKINAVILSHGKDGEATRQFVKEPTPHGLDHVPMYLGFASSMPSVSRKDNTPTLKSRAASVYQSSRTIYEPFNKQISFVMDVAEKSVAGTLVHASKGGNKTLKGDPFANWQVINVDTDEEESITPLEPPKVPAETGVVLSALDRDRQESAVPFPIGYGLDPQAHSGAALSTINDNMRSIYDPFSSLLESLYTWLCEEILKQYKAKGLKTKLNGFDVAGKFFSVEADPDKIEDDWYITCKCEPKLPRDEAGEIQMALSATQPRPDVGPLLSMKTAREKILKLQNSDAEKKLIADETIQRIIDSNPSIQIRKLAQKLLDDGNRDGAMELLATIPAPANAKNRQQQGNSTARGSQGSQQLSAQEQQIIQQIAQKLGIAPEQLLQMTPEQVQALAKEKGVQI